MDYSTNAIVLKAIKYGETSLIINIYTELSGLQTLIVKGVRTHSKKKLFTMGMFQNLNILKVNFTRKKRTKRDPQNGAHAPMVGANVPTEPQNL